MKDILIDGQRILTTDAVADAVMDYACVLHNCGRADLVEFPSLHDGEASRCILLLGASGTLAVMDAMAALPMSFDGADGACAEIVRRADALR